MIERQMDLLKAEVIRMARQTTVQGDGLTDLRSRTVRDTKREPGCNDA